MKNTHNGDAPGRTVLLTVATMLLIGGMIARADDWPDYRGAGRTGVWNETGILEKFPEGGLKILWRTPVKAGFTGPSVANGRVYLTDFNSIQGKRGTERAIALDEKTGKVLWIKEWPVDYAKAGLHMHAEGPAASPIIDGNRVYVLGRTGVLQALDATSGEVLWAKDYARDYQVDLDTWGTASAPIIEGNRLISLVGARNGRVVAFDKMTGKELWRALSWEDHYTGAAPPIVITAGGTRQLIIWHPEALVSLDPATGKIDQADDPSRQPPEAHLCPLVAAGIREQTHLHPQRRGDYLRIFGRRWQVKAPEELPMTRTFAHCAVRYRLLITALMIAIGATGASSLEQATKAQIKFFMNATDGELGDLYLVEGGDHHSLVVSTDDAVVLIDTKRASGWGQTIMGEIRKAIDEPVKTIINTNMHTGGSNAEFPTVIEIIAHENTQANMAKMPGFKGENARFLPNRTFKDKLSLTVKTIGAAKGNNRVDLLYFGPGYTNGDAVVVLPQISVAFLGDLFPEKAVPAVDTANGGSAVAFPDTLARAVAAIKAMKGITIIVPGRAPAPAVPAFAKWLTVADLEEYAEFNRDFLAAVKDAMNAGKTADEAVASLKLPDKYKAYGMKHARDNVNAIYAELRR